MSSTSKYVYCTNPGCDRQDKPFTREILVGKTDCPWCGLADIEDWTQPIPEFTVYTDGSCPKNGVGGVAGPGGYAAIFVKGIENPNRPRAFDPDLVHHVAVGGDPTSTNNRMEISGVLAALKALPDYCRIEIVTDSQYALNGFTTWVHGWVEKGWRTGDGQPVKNQDLWEEAHRILDSHPHDLTFRWVKGHKGHAWNELADKLARQQADSFLVTP